jgi:ribose 5-phosphate isomerase A
MGIEDAKRAVGYAAAELVEDGMVLGLGTGSTARWFIIAAGERAARDGLRLRGVATSRASEILAAEAGIPLIEAGPEGLDLAVDGADVVDPDLRLIKGGGGAHVREKIVAAAARRFVVVVDSAKLFDRLSGPVPVEILSFGSAATLAELHQNGAAYKLRRDAGGAQVVSDNGNLIADGHFDSIADAEGLAQQLDAVPGVVGHGLFLGMADLVLVAHPDGRVEEIVPEGSTGG